VSSALLKVYEKILDKRVRKFLNISGGIPDLQGGFRKKRGCVEHLFSLKELISHRRKNLLPTYLGFLDLSKAFDRTNRDSIWYQLNKIGITGRLFSAITRLYTHSSNQLKMQPGLSAKFSINDGVKQGSPLSPILFSIFINPLIASLCADNRGIKLGNKRIPSLLFADDIVLVARSESDLEKMISCTTEFCAKWKCAINPKKCDIVHATGPKLNKSHFSVPSGSIAQSSLTKYLGLRWFKDGSNWTRHIKQAIAAAKNRAWALVHVGINTRLLSRKLVRYLWSAMIEPILLYGSEIIHLSDNDRKSLNGFQAWVGQLLLNAPRDTTREVIQGELGWLPLDVKFDTRKLIYWKKLHSKAPDQLAKKVYSYSLHTCAPPQETVGFLREVTSLCSQWGLAFDPSLSLPQWKKTVKAHAKRFAAQRWKENTLARKHSHEDYHLLSPKPYCMPPLGPVDFETRAAILAHRAVRPGWLKKRTYGQHLLPCLYCTSKKPMTSTHVMLHCKSQVSLRRKFVQRILPLMGDSLQRFLTYSDSLQRSFLLNPPKDLPHAKEILHATGVYLVSIARNG
jgi:hypothetical protein